MPIQIKISGEKVKSLLKDLKRATDETPIVGERQDEEDVAYIILTGGLSMENERRVFALSATYSGDCRRI